MVKKKINYDFAFNYMEEVYFPTIKQKWLLLHTDPIWYRFILTGIVIEAFMIIFMTPFQIPIFSANHMVLIRIQQVFNVMYLFDLILAFWQKLSKFRYPYPNPIRRPTPVMFMEIVAILPIELIFIKYINDKSYSFDEHRFYITLISMHTLKLPRFFYHIYNNRRDLYNEFRTRILEFIITFTIFCAFVVHMLYMLQYLVTYEELYYYFELLTRNAAGRGALLSIPRNKNYNVYEYEFAISIIGILMWTVVIYPTITFMLLSCIENNKHRYDYSNLVHLFKTKISEKYRMSSEKYKMMMDYFQTNWKLRGGFSKMEFDFMQKSLEIEIAMDTYWPAFKHSMLFRNADFYILRALADKFERRIRMEGEYIFKKNKAKIGLIYIVQGVVEILSAENNESGVICLTSGTCIGEASLIIPHHSSVNFRCKTVCELFELPRDTFMIFQNAYPTEYKQLQLKLFEILYKVRKIKKYNSQFKQKDMERKRIIWLKNNLHNLMSSRTIFKNIHEQTNIYLSHELENCVKEQGYLFHTFEYLDKLAIRERTSTEVDLVFIRRTYPWILKAGSPITNLWEYVIVLLTICCSLAVSYGFFIEYSRTVRLITGTIHFVFVLDIVVQVITPIKPESDSRTLTTVLLERLYTKGFFLDILSVFYWQLIIFVFDTNLPWYELFKLLKIWRVWMFFETWNNRFLVNMIFFAISIGTTSNIILIYFLSCFFTIINILDGTVFPFSIQYATGAGLLFKRSHMILDQNYGCILANVLSFSVQLTVRAMIYSSFYLHYIAKSKILTTIHALREWIKYRDNKWLRLRLHAYFNVLRKDRDVLMSRGNISRLFKLPRYFEIIMKSNLHFEALKQLHLLKDLSNDLITNLLLDTELFTCYRHSVIISPGVLYKEVYVLIKGECRTLTRDFNLVTKPYEPLNFLELCYNFPSVTTTVALSECMILKFSYEAFLHQLYKSNIDYKIFMKTVSITKDNMKNIMFRLLYEPVITVRHRYHNPSFKNFLCFASHNSYEEFDYHVPFDKIKPFDFIKFILMRTTFYPEGKFLQCYEVIRCCVAFVSACVFTIPAINVGAYITGSTGYQLMLGLDLFTVFDMYIRMHVAYYKHKGSLVTHPLYTAKYYMTHGFFIDLISIFPFDVFPMKVQYRTMLNALHALQLHRIAAFKRYHSTHHLYYVLNTITTISYILFAANFVAGLIFVYDCYPWKTEEQIPVAKCKLLQEEKIPTHFHILFSVMSTLYCSGMSGKIMVTNLDSILTGTFCLLTVLGVVMQILYRAYMFSSYIGRTFEKYEFVVGVGRLIRLLSQLNSNKSRYLCKEVSNYYDLHWKHVASKNLFIITKGMMHGLRKEMLFNFYGDNLVTYSIFTENVIDITLFIKNIFLIAMPIVTPKNGYIITVNDIDEYIYFLNKGSVDILAIDGSKVIELTSGALFGNFSGEKYTRLKLSVVANVNSDLVYVSSIDFFKIIVSFPNIKRCFENILRKNIYYIESTKSVEPHLKMTFEEYVKAIHGYSWFRIIHYFHLFYVCYLGTFLEIYQLAVGEMHVLYLTIQYSMDLVHLIREFMKFYTPYKDEHKVPIFDRKKIFLRQLANRKEFYIMIITVIYLDIFICISLVCFGRYQIHEVIYVISVLRINRLLRVYYIYTTYKENQDNPSQNYSNLLKWLYIIYWYILSYQFITAITANLDSITIGPVPNLMLNIPVQKVRNLRFLSSLEKLEMYLRYLFFSNLIHINTNDKWYGPTNTLFNIYIILLYVYQLIIDTVFLCHFFEAMIDVVVLRQMYLKGSSFLKFYMNKSYGTFIVKYRVVENAKHGWTKNYYKSDVMTKEFCARYLQEVIMDNLYGYLLRRHPVFAHAHIDFIRQLTVHLKKVIYPSNFVIVYKKEMRKCMYFIHKGNVAAYDIDFGYQDIALNVLEKGDSFGLLQGLVPFHVLYEFAYITTSHCEIIELEWDSWNYLLKFFPATKQYIFEEASKFAGETTIPYLQQDVLKE